MQLVEDVEKCVLCTGFVASQVLYIVHDECVDAVVEVKEVVDLALVVGGGVLALEESGGHVQYTCLRIVLLDADADGLYQMGLAHTGRTEYHQGVESLVAGVVGDGARDGQRQAIALALAVILKVVLRIQLAVKRLALLRLGCEGVGGSRPGLTDYGRILGRTNLDTRCGLVLYRVVLIEQGHSLAVDFAYGHFEQVAEALVKLLGEI